MDSVGNQSHQTVFDMDYEDNIFTNEEILEPYKEENLPWYKSYPNALLKGLAEGVIGFGEMMGGVPHYKREEVEEAKDIRKNLYREHLPSNKGFLEGALEKGGKTFPALASGGGGVVKPTALSLLSGLSGQSAKEIGFGETGQAIAETAPLVLPDLAKTIPKKLEWKKLIPSFSSEQAELADFARRNGMTEEELTLALQNREPRLVEEFASKGGKTFKAFDKTRQAMGRIWNTLSNSEEAQQQMSGVNSSNFINGLMKRIEKLPAESRKIIKGDMKDLIKSEMKGSDLINFWQDVNYHVKKGERNLGILKEDISKALRSISPELEHDFKLTNQLYGNYGSLAERMGPDISERLIKAGEAGIFVQAVSTGNYPVMRAVLGVTGGRALARELVINPRLQNMSTRFINSISQNNAELAKKAYDQMIVEVGKKNAEAAAKMSEFDIDEFFSNRTNE